MLKKLFSLIGIILERWKKQAKEFAELFSQNEAVSSYEEKYEQLRICLIELEHEYELVKDKRTRTAKQIKSEMEKTRSEMEDVLDRIYQLKSHVISQN